MEPTIDVTFREMPPLPLVEAAIRQRATEIAHRFGEVCGIRIVVDTESNRFLTDHDYIVSATVQCGDGVVVVGEHKRHPDLASAIECMFAALTDRLERRCAARASAALVSRRA